MTNEAITRDVVGYEGLYTIDIFGNVIKTKNGQVVSQQKNKFGYMNVSLGKDGKQKQYKVHRLIAEAFIPNPQNKPQVNHIDGNKSNNVVWNLEWVTCKENVAHAYTVGLTKHGIPVRVVESGKEYKNLTECAKDIHGDIRDIYRCLFTNKSSTHKGYHFERITEWK